MSILNETCPSRERSVVSIKREEAYLYNISWLLQLRDHLEQSIRGIGIGILAVDMNPISFQQRQLLPSATHVYPMEGRQEVNLSSV
jgi:hypothetical protein